MSPLTTQPRVRRNDWGVLDAPRLGEWTPTLSVSVVIPAYGAQRLLPYVLAGLAAQTYPSHLLEVVVADDDPRTRLELPEVRPERTRIVRVEEGWGRANACHTGVLASDGDVVHWLDADMLVEPDQLEAQLRWHHLVDHAVVLGHKWFVDPAPLLAREPAGDGRMHEAFADSEKERHWVEDVWDRTDDLRASGPRALRVHVGATASLRRGLYDDAGGMDTSLRLGEDIELGYRLAECGAVFIADREARSWHLGRSHQQTRQQDVNDYNRPFLSDRVPDLQAQRRQGRSYQVPYLQVVLDTRGLDHGAVIATVDAVLGSSTPDLVVTLLGPWSAITDERTSPLDDPRKSARLVRASYLHEPRVELVESLPDGPSRAMFRLTLHDASWAPANHTLRNLLLHLERTHLGLEQVMMPDGTSVRLERTAAFARARRVAEPGEDLDDVVDELFGSWWVEGADAGFRSTVDLRPQPLRGTSTPALEPATVWRQLWKPRPQNAAGGGSPQPRAEHAAGPGAASPPVAEPRSVRGAIGSLLRRGRH